MPLYFFNVHDGVDIDDELGTECFDIGEARNMAIVTSGEMMRDLSAEFWTDPSDWRMDVTDGDGLAQFTLRFSSR